MLKQTSNDLYREGALQEAVTGYTSAIRLLKAIDEFNKKGCKSGAIQTSVDMHVLLANRAACYMRFSPSDVKSAVLDCERCVALRPAYIKGWLRLAKYNLEAGSRGSALTALRQGLEHHPGHVELVAMLASLDAAKKDGDKENCACAR